MLYVNLTDTENLPQCSIPALLASFVVFIIAIINSINITLLRKRQGLKIVKLMENEIKKRVENIERWDD